MKCSVKVILALAVFLYANCNYVHAEYQDVVKAAPVADAADTPPLLVWNDQQEEEWEAAREQILLINQSNIPERQKCDRAWEITWPLANAGNLEARYAVFNAFRESSPLGYKDDALYTISLAPMSTYLYYYSLGAPSMDVEVTRTLELIKANIRHIDSFPQFKNIYNGPSSFKACVVKRPSQACLQELLRQNAIPTFNRVTEEVDMLFSAGISKPCIDPNNPHVKSRLLTRPVPLVRGQSLGGSDE